MTHGQFLALNPDAEKQYFMTGGKLRHNVQKIKSLIGSIKPVAETPDVVPVAERWVAGGKTRTGSTSTPSRGTSSVPAVSTPGTSTSAVTTVLSSQRRREFVDNKADDNGALLL